MPPSGLLSSVQNAYFQGRHYRRTFRIEVVALGTLPVDWSDDLARMVATLSEIPPEETDEPEDTGPGETDKDEPAGGCGCDSPGQPVGFALLPLALAFIRRRR